MKHIQFTAFTIFLIFISCDTLTVQSIYIKDTVKIDGRGNEWSPILQKTDDEQFSIGVMNDEGFIYLYLISHNQAISEQIMRFGIEVKLQSTTEKKKLFALSLQKREPLHGLFRREYRDSLDVNKIALPEIIEVADCDGDEGHPMTLAAARSLGIDVMVDMRDKRYCCEMKMPLRRDSLHPFAIGEDVINYVQLSLSALKPEITANHGKNRPLPDMRNGPGGGMTQRGGMPPSGRGNMSGGQGPYPGRGEKKVPQRSFEQFSFKALVQLATQPVQ